MFWSKSIWIWFWVIRPTERMCTAMIEWNGGMITHASRSPGPRFRIWCITFAHLEGCNGQEVDCIPWLRKAPFCLRLQCNDSTKVLGGDFHWVKPEVYNFCVSLKLITLATTGCCLMASKTLSTASSLLSWRIQFSLLKGWSKSFTGESPLLSLIL